VSHYLTVHPLLIFASAAFAYLLALAIFQVLVPRLGAPSEAEIPLSTT
jgi:ACS family hexuronate transporter-like MFS transporter